MLLVLEEYFCSVNTLNPEKGSWLAAAVSYIEKQRAALCSYLENGNVSISNILTENTIHPFAVD